MTIKDTSPALTVFRVKKGKVYPITGLVALKGR
jgi:hypothetical protein